MTKQLNIRSDEARETVDRLAKRLATSRTDVVVRALRQFDRATFQWPTADDLSPQQRKDHENFMALVGRARTEMLEGPKFGEEDLYDDSGLPK